jgi:hypothetical protein
MKLIISKSALEMAVKNICRVINSKNALPILGDEPAHGGNTGGNNGGNEGGLEP